MHKQIIIMQYLKLSVLRINTRKGYKLNVKL